jgi:pyridoxamine 5'-phosphate oxidase
MRAQPDLAAMRSSYARAGLSEDEAPRDPMELFARWLEAAEAARLPEPNAMVLATATPDGVPSARTVLLKGLDERGFVFFTNLRSAKGQELAANPRAALVFPWHALERQVRVTGQVWPLPRTEVATYFGSRPYGSRLGALSSPQSEVVDGRAELDQRYAATAAQFPEGTEVPVPDFWGGYVVTPEMVEFWAGRENRLHDRLRYRRSPGSGPDPWTAWTLERLAP